MEKLPQTLEKLPQTEETSIDREIQNRWFEALRSEDGYTLMTLVVRKPQLLTLTYRGRNALHLAMKYNWYGLVQEIVAQFQHLYTAEDGRSPTKGDGSSENRLDLDVFRNLLTCKEGGNQMSETTEGGSSGLDVLAMAVIQGHQAINSILVRTIFSLPGLFYGHSTYKEYDFRVYEGYRDSSETTDEERKILWGLLRQYPELKDMPDADHAPNMNAPAVPGEEGLWFERASYIQNHRLVGHLQNWMLTCPFLPLSEYLILEFSTSRSNYRTGEDGDDSTVFTPLFREGEPFLKKSFRGFGKIQRHFEEAFEGSTSFVKYVASISDTRRTVWHYVLLNSPFWEAHENFQNILHKLISIVSEDDLEDIYNIKDSSGRTALHLLVASGPPPCFNHYREDHPLSEARFLPWLFRSGGWNAKIHKIDNSFDYWVGWRHDNFQCLINLNSIGRANGYVCYQVTKGRPIPGDHDIQQIILTSPHLTGTARMNWIELLRKSGFYLHHSFLRPSVQGVTADVLLTPFQYCIMKGYNTFVQRMVQDDRYYDPARINGADEENSLSSQSQKSDDALEFPLLLAAKHADPEILRIMLGADKFDPHCQDHDGNTLLHAAVSCEDPISLPIMLVDFVELPKKCPHESHDLEQSLMTKAQQREKEKRHRESRRQGCINLLLQEGLHIWETNASGQIADPGPKASPEYSLWWYERLAREMQDEKTSFGAAGSAVSVTAALVATASYIGPLQPPLGYSGAEEDAVSKVQTELPAVRVFFVLNTLAFYLAIAAVVLSLTPALPVPHESTHAELKRIRRSVIWALSFLIVSLIAILSAFASASMVVIPNAERWLTIAPILMGCILCVVVLIFCCIRAIKLMSHKNSVVGRLYRKWIKKGRV